MDEEAKTDARRQRTEDIMLKFLVRKSATDRNGNITKLHDRDKAERNTKTANDPMFSLNENVTARGEQNADRTNAKKSKQPVAKASAAFEDSNLGAKQTAGLQGTERRVPPPILKGEVLQATVMNGHSLSQLQDCSPSQVKVTETDLEKQYLVRPGLNSTDVNANLNGNNDQKITEAERNENQDLVFSDTNSSKDGGEPLMKATQNACEKKDHSWTAHSLQKVADSFSNSKHAEKAERTTSDSQMTCQCDRIISEARVDDTSAATTERLNCQVDDVTAFTAQRIPSFTRQKPVPRRRRQKRKEVSKEIGDVESKAEQLGNNSIGCVMNAERKDHSDKASGSNLSLNHVISRTAGNNVSAIKNSSNTSRLPNKRQDTFRNFTKSILDILQNERNRSFISVEEYIPKMERARNGKEQAHKKKQKGNHVAVLESVAVGNGIETENVSFVQDLPVVTLPDVSNHLLNELETSEDRIAAPSRIGKPQERSLSDITVRYVNRSRTGSQRKFWRNKKKTSKMSRSESAQTAGTCRAQSNSDKWQPTEADANPTTSKPFRGDSNHSNHFSSKRASSRRRKSINSLHGSTRQRRDGNGNVNIESHYRNHQLTTGETGRQINEGCVGHNTSHTAAMSRETGDLESENTAIGAHRNSFEALSDANDQQSEKASSINDSGNVGSATSSWSRTASETNKIDVNGTDGFDTASSDFDTVSILSLDESLDVSHDHAAAEGSFENDTSSQTANELNETGDDSNEDNAQPDCPTIEKNEDISTRHSKQQSQWQNRKQRAKRAFNNKTSVLRSRGEYAVMHKANHEKSRGAEELNTPNEISKNEKETRGSVLLLKVARGKEVEVDSVTSESKSSAENQKSRRSRRLPGWKSKLRPPILTTRASRDGERKVQSKTRSPKSANKLSEASKQFRARLKKSGKASEKPTEPPCQEVTEISITSDADADDMNGDTRESSAMSSDGVAMPQTQPDEHIHQKAASSDNDALRDQPDDASTPPLPPRRKHRVSKGALQSDQPRLALGTVVNDAPITSVDGDSSSVSSLSLSDRTTRTSDADRVAFKQSTIGEVETTSTTEADNLSDALSSSIEDARTITQTGKADNKENLSKAGQSWATIDGDVICNNRCTNGSQRKEGVRHTEKINDVNNNRANAVVNFHVAEKVTTSFRRASAAGGYDKALKPPLRRTKSLNWTATKEYTLAEWPKAMPQDCDVTSTSTHGDDKRSGSYDEQEMQGERNNSSSSYTSVAGTDTSGITGYYGRMAHNRYQTFGLSFEDNAFERSRTSVEIKDFAEYVKVLEIKHGRHALSTPHVAVNRTPGAILEQGRDIYVSDSDGDCIDVYSPTGQHKSTINIPGSPRGLTSYTSRHVLCATSFDGDISVVDMEKGAVVRKVGTDGILSHPRCVAMHPCNQTFIVSDIRLLYQWQLVMFDVRTGDVVSSINSSQVAENEVGWPEFVTYKLNSENEIFATDSQGHALLAFDFRGGKNPTTTIGSRGHRDGQFISPCGVAHVPGGRITLDSAPGGSLLVADWGNNRVSAFDANTGQFQCHVISEKDEPLKNPLDIKVDVTGAIYLTESGSNNVKVFRSS